MQFIDDLFSLFKRHDEDLFYVGGFVRDSILGRSTGDIDLATGSLPEKTVEILESGGFRAIPVGMEFGTVGTFLHRSGTQVEVQITTYRSSESYRSGSRHPVVTFGRSIEEDLTRRDFTVNAMAMDMTGNLIDPLDGMDDIRHRILRTPGDPETTFREDPLRMLRAFRFACSLGFQIDESILNVISERHSDILSVSRERWKQEMDRMMVNPDGSRLAEVLGSMMSSGILTDMIPELKDLPSTDESWHGMNHTGGLWEHTLDVVSGLGPDSCLRWAGLFHDIGKPVTRSVDSTGNTHFHMHEKTGVEAVRAIAGRLKFSKREKHCVTYLVRNHMRPVLYSSDWSDRAVRKLMRDSGENLGRLMDLAEADISSHSDAVREEGLVDLGRLRERIASLEPLVRQRMLPKELGRVLAGRVGSDIATSSEVGTVLENLEELVRNGTLPSMAPVSFYLHYISEHPELRGSLC